jgi:hypothetical protein
LIDFDHFSLDAEKHSEAALLSGTCIAILVILLFNGFAI